MSILTHNSPIHTEQSFDQRVPMINDHGQPSMPPSQQLQRPYDPVTSTSRPLYEPNSHAGYAVRKTPSQGPSSPGYHQHQVAPPTGPAHQPHRAPADPRQPITVTLLKREGEGFGFEYIMTRNGGFMISEFN